MDSIKKKERPHSFVEVVAVPAKVLEFPAFI
jgi:hypothetical protein